ncbi:MAG: sigma 54-interacting transcriptional regulator [Desulfobacterales bacterium]|jgi:Nif-specific regulatory protein|nr:sigma 54-interacting transcriptional regulator [Desulfobacterales bacterium]
MSKPDVIEALYTISQGLNQGLDLRESLHRALIQLSDFLTAAHGVICLLNPLRNEVHIEVSHGIWENVTGERPYKRGDQISSRVIETGQPTVIPRISQDPQFETHAGFHFLETETELSLICVPLIKGRRVIGAMSLFVPYDTPNALEKNKKIISIAAAVMTRQATQLEAIRFETEKRLEQDQKRLQGEKPAINTAIIGSSNKMREVFEMIAQVSDSNATVLIRGESGTGKELVANAVHNNSPRAKYPFIKLNCAAIPTNLIESELFGHEKGAFTGAIKQKPGKFELAHRGSIFLDEIGAIDLSVQVKLLRVLQEKEFERVGGQQPRKIDVRIIAATNKNLEEAVEEGGFRGDLYYRLNVFPIYLPPLRERKTDILLLAEYFLEKYAHENSKEIRRLSTPAIDMLMAYHWPGNVRELENCIERAVLVCNQGVIHSYHLPPTLQTGSQSDTLPMLSLASAANNLEKEMIIDALKNCRGNITDAARMLRTTVRKLGYKLKKLGINYRQYR